MVVTTAADVTPPPDAVALLVSADAANTSLVIVKLALQEISCPAASELFEAPQLIGTELTSPSVMVNCAGPNVVVPVFLIV